MGEKRERLLAEKARELGVNTWIYCHCCGRMRDLRYRGQEWERGELVRTFLCDCRGEIKVMVPPTQADHARWAGLA